MTDIDRRSLLRTLMAAPVAASLAWTQAEASLASELAQAAQAAAARTGAAFTPKFFSAHEWQTVRLLVDLIIPRDERSGSATDAGVPEFMDFMMIDQPGAAGRHARRARVAGSPMRGTIRQALRRVCRRRTYRDPRRARLGGRARSHHVGDGPRHAGSRAAGGPRRTAARTVLPRHGVLFFNSFRDLTATGFCTSKMGIEDLRYMGNRVVRTWSRLSGRGVEETRRQL
jgi:hypothetical protein